MSATITTTANKNLQYVSELDDYKVHHDDVDIRGYELRDFGGTVIGEVKNLIADVPARQVRYAEVEMNDNILALYRGNTYSVEDRHFLIPVGLININTDDNSITAHGINAENYANYPRYDRNTGYSTAYEIDTNDYLSDFHEYGNTYDRNRYSTEEYRRRTELDTDFYGTRYYNRR